MFQGGLRFGGSPLERRQRPRRRRRHRHRHRDRRWSCVAWVLSVVIRFALSRSREFLADAGSVELTKNPDAMISALRKIEGRGELPGATSAVMEMCIDNPREGFAELFDTHPSVESRVARWCKYAGGHDPGPLALPRSRGADPPAGGETPPQRTSEAGQRPSRGDASRIPAGRAAGGTLRPAAGTPYRITPGRGPPRVARAR